MEFNKAFPTLFKANSSGSLQYWEISVEAESAAIGVPGILITRFGQIGTTNPQETRDVISKGKNQGKKNETTALDQALFEAQAKWEKQIKKGYVEDRTRAAAEENDLKGIPTMLAHKYSEHAEKIVFPAAVQPKLDGIRCLTKSDGTLWSRSQKPITSVPHIQEAIRSLFPAGIPLLDGELYNHEFKSNFEKIVSIVRQTKKVDPEHELVEYHIYDIALPDVPYVTRMKFLRDTILSANHKFLRFVPTSVIETHDELMHNFRKCRELGFEGAMVRNLDSLYEGKRSYGLQKVKEFDEAEFRIVGIVEGRGKLQGHVGSFTCITDAGDKFEAKMEGELSNLKRFFGDISLWENQMLTVQFQGFTTKNKVPRFPVGLRLREPGL